MYISAWLSLLFLVVAVVANIVANATKKNEDVKTVFNNMSYAADGLFLIAYIVFLVMIKMRHKSAVVSLVFLVCAVVAIIIGIALLLSMTAETAAASVAFFSIAGVCGVGFFISYIVLMVTHYKSCK